MTISITSHSINLKHFIGSISLCFLLLSTAIGTAQVIDDSFQTGNDWYHSGWLGSYYSNDQSSWVYSEDLEWLYVFAQNPSSYWMFQINIAGWIWTNPEVYPFIYHAIDGWLYYVPSADGLSYYVLSTGTWNTIPRISPPTPEPEPGPEPDTNPLELSSLQIASRFLSHATMGADMETIQYVSSIGVEAWLNEQLAKPTSSLEAELYRVYPFMDPANDIETEAFAYFGFRTGWWGVTMTGEDLLRQRIAFALSQIFVVSDNIELIGDNPIAMADYYDMLLRNSFGNFRQLLEDVTMHPVMGHYLSHAGNRKADPASGRFPDENYAREIMQLFTIGLHELNPDGTEKLNSNGEPIPTYDNNDITNFARVFTGFHYDVTELVEIINENLSEFLEGIDESETTYPRPEINPPVQIETLDFDLINYANEVNLLKPMLLYEHEHDMDAKTLLNGQTLPAGQGAEKDVSDALDNLFNHPNTGPFISRLLIQRLVKSNPSPEYVARVANVFADNGSGVRGDLRSVVWAILLDGEASSLSLITDQAQGKMREPFIRLTHYLRAFNARPENTNYTIVDFEYGDAFLQRPLSSPSVFNFYSPDYRPLGAVGDAGLVAPEFQITNAYSLTRTYDIMQYAIMDDEIQLDVIDETDENGFNPNLKPWTVELSDELALINDPPALIERLDTILTHGTLSQRSKQSIQDSVIKFQTDLDADANEAVRFAIYLVLHSPDYVISR